MSRVLPAGARALRGRIAGRVVLPGDTDWDSTHRPWNLAARRRPSAVALPESAADVQAIVAFARSCGLRNGQVLVVCGVHDPGVPPCVAELYNPATGTWSQDGQAGPSAARDFSAVLLHTGQVLFSGGLNGVYPAKVHVAQTATLFDPATATSTSTGGMTIPREGHTLTVLAAGGETQNKQGEFSITASAELYTP